ncbi:hypothetical protein B0H14DRAFT_2563085 [Mycena olivaceomarginata]|nr:hypothetical protein B0H14DRAFT_2563085 [Mycena olivaceomarginata]
MSEVPILASRCEVKQRGKHIGGFWIPNLVRFSTSTPPVSWATAVSTSTRVLRRVPVHDKHQRDESLHPLYNTAQYSTAGCELSNLLVNSASYSASSFSFIDVCTEGGVQGLWYYVYGTGPLALVDLSCGRAELKRTGLKFVSGGTMGTGALYSGVGDSEELKFRGTYECGGG